jgi:hypothetical protein
MPIIKKIYACRKALAASQAYLGGGEGGSYVAYTHSLQ